MLTILLVLIIAQKWICTAEKGEIIFKTRRLAYGLVRLPPVFSTPKMLILIYGVRFYALQHIVTSFKNWI
jgi:hypothetical protein